MSTTTVPTKIQPYNKRQLAAMYDVGKAVFNAWLLDVPELGTYRGRCFTTTQVEKIINHCGPPHK